MTQVITNARRQHTRRTYGNDLIAAVTFMTDCDMFCN